MSNKFSVLLPIYHGDKIDYVEQAVSSVIHQTLPPDEIVFVFDGQVDHEIENFINTLSTVRDNIKYKVCKLLVNKGLGEALRIGLEYCSNELVARMDADDISLPHRFEKQVSLFHEYKELDIIGSYIAEFELDPEKPVSVRTVPLNTDEIYKYAEKRNPFNHMSVMFKKSAVEKAKGYQHMPYFEDYYLWIRMIKNKCTMMNIPEVLVLSRTGKEMYNRRGGLKYIRAELDFQKKLLQYGLINNFQFVQNISLRFLIRLAPNIIRRYVYQKKLRNKLKNEGINT